VANRSVETLSDLRPAWLAFAPAAERSALLSLLWPARSREEMANKMLSAPPWPLNCEDATARVTVIVLGEAPAEHLCYYPGWNTITQNRAGDITFDCMNGRVDVYVSSPRYQVDFLYNAGAYAALGLYIGSFDV
jgi:hypothetical protein